MDSALMAETSNLNNHEVEHGTCSPHSIKFQGPGNTNTSVMCLFVYLFVYVFVYLFCLLIHLSLDDDLPSVYVAMHA